jgi:hypothetical protein
MAANSSQELQIQSHTSAADLKFLLQRRHARSGTSNRKAALES